MYILGSCTSLYYVVVDGCSLATDGVLAYVHFLPHPLLMLQPRRDFFLGGLLSKSETSNYKTREGTDLFGYLKVSCSV